MVWESDICTQYSRCAFVCPIRDRDKPERKAVNMAQQPPLRLQEKENGHFLLFGDRMLVANATGC